MFLDILSAILSGVLFLNAQESCKLPPWAGCEQLIIDTDGTASDCVGIVKVLYAYKHGLGPAVRAITIVNGVTNVNQAAINIGKVLSYSGLTDIPFYIGEAEPLVPPTLEGLDVYGKDALGDVIFNGTIPPPTPGSAAQILVDLVNELGDKAIVMTLGPLTNIAIAQRIDPEFLTKLKRLNIAGGSVKGSGRTRPGVEYDVVLDPYAFKFVIAHTNYRQATLYPLDLVADIVNPRSFWDNLPETSENYVAFVNSIIGIFHKSQTSFVLSPLVASASVGYPRVFSQMEPLRVQCVTSDDARGVLLVDYANKDVNPATSNLLVVFGFDLEEYLRFNLRLATL